MKIKGKLTATNMGTTDAYPEAIIHLEAEELIRQVIEQDKSKELLIELDAEFGKKICATEQKECGDLGLKGLSLWIHNHLCIDCISRLRKDKNV